MSSLVNKYCYEYPRPSLTADCVIFGFNGKTLKVLLVERGIEPFKGYWALPGGFMHMDETIEETAARELNEETNLSNVFLDQFRVYSRTDRDPRGRVVTVAFIALVRPEQCRLLAGDDAASALWFDFDTLPPMAFDHSQIIADAREHLKEILVLKPVAFNLLNKIFTISELQTVYEVINGARYDRRNFLRTAIDSSVISEVDVTPDYDCCNAESITFDCCCRSQQGRPTRLYTASESLDSDDENENEEDECKRSAPTKGLFDFFRRKK